MKISFVSLIDEVDLILAENILPCPGFPFVGMEFYSNGYAVAAGIGGSAAAPDRLVTCIIGDGGLQLCLGELATVVIYQIPRKIIFINNHAHGIQKQTLETWLDGNYVGVDPASGLGLTDFTNVAEAMGLPIISISKSSEI